eukprot:3820205-Prymnesium_polylepis.1
MPPLLPGGGGGRPPVPSPIAEPSMARSRQLAYVSGPSAEFHIQRNVAGPRQLVSAGTRALLALRRVDVVSATGVLRLSSVHPARVRLGGRVARAGWLELSQIWTWTWTWSGRARAVTPVGAGCGGADRPGPIRVRFGTSAPDLPAGAQRRVAGRELLGDVQRLPRRDWRSIEVCIGRSGAAAQLKPVQPGVVGVNVHHRLNRIARRDARRPACAEFIDAHTRILGPLIGLVPVRGWHSRPPFAAVTTDDRLLARGLFEGTVIADPFVGAWWLAGQGSLLIRASEDAARWDCAHAVVARPRD